jgi:tRNA A-37 threonylcarbamoyl transferase component Bud32
MRRNLSQIIVCILAGLLNQYGSSHPDYTDSNMALSKVISLIIVCILSGLLNQYGSSHPDYTDSNMALSKVRTIIKRLSSKLKESVRRRAYIMVLTLS